MRRDAYVASQLKGIFGIEIEIARIEGKWKTSQNQPEADRVGVAEGLAAEGDVTMSALGPAVSTLHRGAGSNRSAASSQSMLIS